MVTSSTAVRSFADDVRGRSDADLAELLLVRPDLGRPRPADLTSMAARAATRASVQQALTSLDRGQMAVLDAVLAGSDSTGARAVTTPTVARLLGESVEVIASTLDALWTRALLWRAGDAEAGVRVARAVIEIVGPGHNGLGPSLSELPALHATPTSSREIRQLVESAPPAATAVLETLTWGPPVGLLGGGAAAREGVAWLAATGLVGTVSHDRIVLPREVALALRGDRVHRVDRVHPPQVDLVMIPASDCSASAGAAAGETVSLVEELVSRWGVNPPRVLRTGGLGVRELTALARALDIPEAYAGWLVELSAVAGLIDDDRALHPTWSTTSEVDEWLAAPMVRRLERLVTAWLTTTRAPHLVGQALSGGTSVKVLGPDVQWPPVVRLRRDLLAELATLPAGAVPAVDTLVPRLAWRRPMRMPRFTEELTTALMTEAGWLGLMGRGAISPAGVAATNDTDPHGVLSALAELLPDDIDHIVLQADQTALAPGPLDAALGAFMRLVGDIESRGAATVYRLSASSVRRALDAGMTADEILARFADASRTPVPHTVDYLVRDVARRHGVTRLGGVSSYLRSDDEATVAGILADSRLASMRWRLIAPTVLVCSVDPADALDRLREAGYAPAVESIDGSVIASGPAVRRVRSRRSTRSAQPPTLDAAGAVELARQLREADGAANALVTDGGDPRTGLPPAADPGEVLEALRQAIADGHGVWIGYSDHNGSTSPTFFYPDRIEAGRAWGLVPGSRSEVGFTLHRITGVVTG